MNTETPLFAICIEANIYLLLHNLHDCTFKNKMNFVVRNINCTESNKNELSSLLSWATIPVTDKWENQNPYFW